MAQSNAGLITKVFLFFAAFIFVIMLFTGTFYTVDAGDRALLLTFGSLSQTVGEPGLHLKIPIFQQVVIMSVRTQTITFDNKQATGSDSEYSSLAAFSQDLQDVAIATIVNYHLEDKDVLDIYTKYGNMQNYQQNILEPIIRDTVKTTAAKFTAEELNSKRAEFSKEVSDSLTQKFSQKSAVFDKLSITNFEYTTEFAAAINRKVIAEQDALAAKNKLEQVKYEATQKVAAATGDAQALTVQGEALRANPEVLQLRAIEKWNGVTPLVTGGATPFINLNGLTATTTTA